MTLPIGYLFHIDLYGKNLQTSSCVKLVGADLWYLVCHFIKAIFDVKFLFRQTN